MPTGTELDILKVIRDEGGETTVQVVAHKFGPSWSLDYIRVMCNSLGRADYIDVLRSGKLRITDKGKASVEGK